MNTMSVTNLVGILWMIACYALASLAIIRYLRHRNGVNARFTASQETSCVGTSSWFETVEGVSQLTEET
jgi:hypothetical protein